MTDQLARRMRNLQEARELDDIDAAAYERGLAKLRAQYGDAAVNALLHQPEYSGPLCQDTKLVACSSSL
ncbi:MAG: hypothetical protein ACLFVO_25645, partial [Chloroflexaceae bacterium]